MVPSQRFAIPTVSPAPSRPGGPGAHFKLLRSSVGRLTTDITRVQGSPADRGLHSDLSGFSGEVTARETTGTVWECKNLPTEQAEGEQAAGLSV